MAIEEMFCFFEYRKLDGQSHSLHSVNYNDPLKLLDISAAWVSSYSCVRYWHSLNRHHFDRVTNVKILDGFTKNVCILFFFLWKSGQSVVWAILGRVLTLWTFCSLAPRVFGFSDVRKSNSFLVLFLYNFTLQPSSKIKNNCLRSKVKKFGSLFTTYWKYSAWNHQNV